MPDNSATQERVSREEIRYAIAMLRASNEGIEFTVSDEKLRKEACEHFGVDPPEEGVALDKRKLINYIHETADPDYLP